jgi:hypothetical protein
VIKIALSTRKNPGGGASPFFSSEEGNVFLEMLYSFWNVRQWVAFRNQVLSKCDTPLLGPFTTTLLFFFFDSHIRLKDKVAQHASA